jgi:hypothetical protein
VAVRHVCHTVNSTAVTQNSTKDAESTTSSNANQQRCTELLLLLLVLCPPCSDHSVTGVVEKVSTTWMNVWTAFSSANRLEKRVIRRLKSQGAKLRVSGKYWGSRLLCTAATWPSTAAPSKLLGSASCLCGSCNDAKRNLKPCHSIFFMYMKIQYIEAQPIKWVSTSACLLCWCAGAGD